MLPWNYIECVQHALLDKTKTRSDSFNTKFVQVLTKL